MITSLFDEQLENTKNELIYSNYGLYPAFCFRGTSQFISKITNFIVNYSILGNGKIYTLYDENSKYILVPEDRILNGIKESFRNEIIMNHELYDIDYNFEIIDAKKDGENTEFQLTWDESKVESLALNLTATFWVNNVKKTNVLQHYVSSNSNEEFNLGNIDSLKSKKAR